MGRNKLNPGDRKVIDRDMRYLVWDRDARSCKRCGKVLYQTRKPKGHVHHIDSNRGNNKATNLVLLCRSCHREVHHIYKENIFEYVWEIELITRKKCDLSMADVKARYPCHRYYYTTQLINELEREDQILSLPDIDKQRLTCLKALEVKMKAELKEAIKANDLKEKERHILEHKKAIEKEDKQ